MVWCIKRTSERPQSPRRRGYSSPANVSFKFLPYVKSTINQAKLTVRGSHASKLADRGSTAWWMPNPPISAPINLKVHPHHPISLISHPSPRPSPHSIHPIPSPPPSPPNSPLSNSPHYPSPFTPLSLPPPPLSLPHDDSSLPTQQAHQPRPQPTAMLYWIASSPKLNPS